MLRTITLGSCVSVQGIVVGHKPDGRVMIRVDEQVFVGVPVAPASARPEPVAPQSA
ncbi:MAG TPA: hypothetical protein PKD10_01415 [Paracoccaceae bacterium]|nr:hypothetical protein [Paracoccaceae bacterium]HMO70306.1 hypothetical protein [Paracoccaceae bacterium]